MKKLIFLLLIAYTSVANAQFVFRDGTAAARVDTLVLKADKLWFKNKATGSIFYARTAGDTLYLGDATGEKALINMGGVTPLDGILKWNADSSAYWLYPEGTQKTGGLYKTFTGIGYGGSLSLKNSADSIIFPTTGDLIQGYRTGLKFKIDQNGYAYTQGNILKVDSSEFETHRIKLNYNFATDGVATAKVIEKQIPLGSIIKYIIIREDTTLTSTSGTSNLAVYLGSSGEETICTKKADNNNSTDWINSMSESGTYHWGNIPFNEDLRILIPADITAGTVTFYIEYIFNP